MTRVTDVMASAWPLRTLGLTCVSNTFMTTIVNAIVNASNTFMTTIVNEDVAIHTNVNKDVVVHTYRQSFIGIACAVRSSTQEGIRKESVRNQEGIRKESGRNQEGISKESGRNQ
jgi:hypothetical protein